MNKHGKKMIAPIVITVILGIYFLFYFFLLVALIPGVIAKALFGVIPFVLFLVAIGVCIQRIKEIRSGEEDDLSKY